MNGDKLQKVLGDSEAVISSPSIKKSKLSATTKKVEISIGQRQRYSIDSSHNQNEKMSHRKTSIAPYTAKAAETPSQEPKKHFATFEKYRLSQQNKGEANWEASSKFSSASKVMDEPDLRDPYGYIKSSIAAQISEKRM